MSYNRTNQFRNSVNARYLDALFYERVNADKTTVLFTLKDEDYKSYPSLYRLYMESNDPTEYSFAVAHLDGFEHWQMLCRCAWFKPYLERWRNELAEKLRSEALMRLIKDSQNPDSKTAPQSARYIAERGWERTANGNYASKKPGRGRPSNEEVTIEAKRLAEEAKSFEDDFKRLSTPSIQLISNRRN